MVFLLMVGIIELVVGMVLLLAPEPFKGLCGFCDKVFWDIDKRIEPYKFWVGISGMILGGWLLYLAFRFPEASPLLHPFWIIFLFFSVLYMFLPHWMVRISKAAHRKVLPVDEYIMGTRRISGFIFVVVSIYIFYLSYMAWVM